ncbi:MAG: zinc ribbon domain-containing protein [Nitrospirae bacterium]|uniref:zinc ribbon domain-containing protein n=1 Tax=Candidatus Magnetobacterium casense TaxID=1455061 RepID=UPI00058E73DE|nr:zinc ribbon domain-containing protein [Candidatus Magnetobacterium casensis]MBF0338894.1 zinc ribbon domain-containing protein [Nitrospirota bacterium]
MADFLKKITDGIDKGVKTISSKSKEFMEVTRLKGELNDIEATLQDKFIAVGKKVFQMMNQGTLKEAYLKAECAEISSCYKKITEIKDTIIKVEKEAFKVQYGFDAVMCQACGGVNKITDKFCNICGSTIETEGKANSRHCPTCNSMVSAGAKFCASCGKAMPKDSQTTEAETPDRVCRNCSRKISAEEIFCQSCGTKQ